MYQETNENWVYHVDTQSRIPKWADDSLTIKTEGWLAYEAWRAEGNTPLPPDERWINERRGKQVVSRFQARAALHIHSVLADVEAMIQAADPITQMAWADARDVERPSPTIAAMAQALGWTDEFVDALFVTASGIKA